MCFYLFLLENPAQLQASGTFYLFNPKFGTKCRRVEQFPFSLIPNMPEGGFFFLFILQIGSLI